jgi:hypothetical protein
MDGVAVDSRCGQPRSWKLRVKLGVLSDPENNRVRSADMSESMTVAPSAGCLGGTQRDPVDMYSLLSFNVKHLKMLRYLTLQACDSGHCLYQRNGRHADRCAWSA